jgi:hypothetical protein
MRNRSKKVLRDEGIAGRLSHCLVGEPPMNDPTPLEAIFFAALEKGSPQERAAYLGEACAGDADLRRHVEKMLAAQAKAEEEKVSGPFNLAGSWEDLIAPP